MEGSIMNLKRTRLEHDYVTGIDTIVEYELTEEEYQEELRVLAEHEINQIRAKREDCFRYINRGLAWYNTLTENQKNELQVWYQNWLDAPSTKIIPEIPIWLK